MATLTGGIFVGRHPEMAELKAALEDALSGQGRLVMLVGEPGIGKTRISQELAAYAMLKGAQVFWGRCHAAEGAPPYWPWVQIIRSCVQSGQPDQLRLQMGAGAADIAEVVSEVRERLPDLESPPALEPQQARFRFFDSMTRFFKQATQAQCMVMILDNIHWADRASLQLLEFLAQEIMECHLLVVGTYRDTELTRRHPLTHTLGELPREPLFHRVPLRGLNEEDVAQFIEVTAGLIPPRELVRALRAQADGNPLFVNQVVQLLVQEGQLTPERAREQQTWSIMIPAGVREVIRRRLDRLSDQCNQVLTIASVVGREFELELLEQLMVDPSPGSGGGLSGDELLEAVEEALAAKVIEEVPQTMSRYQFAHVLIQNTLVQELSAARRARLHRRIGETLEERYEGATETHAAELAYHFAQALTATDIQKLTHYSLLAGERALNSYAYEEAVVHFQRVLAAKEAQPVDADTAALLFGLGRAQAATLEQYEMQDAVASLSRAFDYYAEIGDLPRAVAVAGCALRSHAGQRIGAIRLVARALDLVPPDSPQGGSLLAQYGLVLGMENGDYNGAQQAFGQSLAIARHEQDLALEMRTLASASEVDYYHLHYQESLEKSLSAIKLSQSIDDPVSLVGAYLSATHCLDRFGDLAGARRYGAAMLAVAEKLRDRNRLALALRNNGVLAWQVGDLPAARDFFGRALAIEPTQSNILFNQALIEYELGNFSQGETHLQRLLEVMTWHQPGPSWAYATPALVIPMIARITGVAERLDIARSVATTVVSSPSPTARIALAARASLALIAVLTGDVAAAGEQYAALKPGRGTTLTACLSVDRVLGLSAQTMGQLDEAAEHFEEAFSFCRKGGQRPELAWTCHDYAEALLQRNGPGDRARAMSLLEEALSISSELGMRPLMERVVALKDKVESQPRRGNRPIAPTYPDGLTEREVEVLRRIAAGKTDREIAEELFISVRTVTTHVSNILNKTSTANRTEAATYTARHGLA